jgi:hypothetical protein
MGADIDEQFWVEVTGATNATLATSHGVGTIRDDDRIAIDPALPRLYFADTTGRDQDHLWIANPHPVTVTAKLTATKATGAGRTWNVVLAARTRVQVQLQTQTGLVNEEFSTTVQTTNPAYPLYAQHTAYTPGQAGGRTTEGVTPAPAWFFAEGLTRTALEETDYVTVFNPSGNAVTATLEFVLPTGVSVPHVLSLAPGPSRARLRVNDLAALVNTEHALAVTAVVSAPRPRSPSSSSGPSSGERTGARRPAHPG